MKKFIVIFLVMALSFSLVSCDPGSYRVDTDSMLLDVLSVELIEYDNPDQDHFLSWVPDHFDDLKPFDHSRVTVLNTLPEENIEAFVKDFGECDILHQYYAYDSPDDIVIRCNYKNGDFLIIWADYENQSFGGYIGEYAADGTVKTFWGSFSALPQYTDLVSKYFQKSVEKI